MKNYKYYLNKLGIEVVQILRNNTEEGYFVIIGNIGSQLVLLKLISKSSHERMERTKKDIAIEAIINKYNLKHLDKINKNRIINTGEDKDFIWIIREYIRGSSLATTSNKNSTLLYSYDLIDEKFYDKKNKILDCVVATIDAIRQIKVSSFYINEGLSFTSRFPQNISEEYVQPIERGIDFNLNDQINFSNKLYSKKNQSSNTAMCFGDLVPANIIYGEDGKIYFSDFEWFGFDNYMFDVTYLWLFLWRYPNWQTYFLDKTISNQKDRNYFRANLIKAVIGWYNSMKIFKKEKNFRNDEFKNHIWTRYLIAAGQSFDSIMKVEP